MKDEKDTNYLDTEYFETPGFVNSIPEGIRQILALIIGETVFMYLIPFILATFRIESTGWAPVPTHYGVVEFDAGHFIFWYLVFWLISAFVYIPLKLNKYAVIPKKTRFAFIAAVLSALITAAIYFSAKLRIMMSVGKPVICFIFPFVSAFMAWICSMAQKDK